MAYLDILHYTHMDDFEYDGQLPIDWNCLASRLLRVLLEGQLQPRDGGRNLHNQLAARDVHEGRHLVEDI